jgi:hypothetical protein
MLAAARVSCYKLNPFTSITISSIEYIEVIKLLEKTFEIKVSSIEFFAFYHPLFTFLPACQAREFREEAKVRRLDIVETLNYPFKYTH